MKLATFRHEGRTSWGVVTDGGIVDAGKALGERFPTLRDAIAADALKEVEALATSDAETVPLDAVTFLPVIPNPDKILCAGVNYEEHRVETNREKTAQPTIFLRLAASQIGHGQPLLLPPESDQFDYEGEIAVVIGKAGRRIKQADAWAHVAGYAPYNDGSIRDWQRHTTQWTGGKNFAATGAFGPWMVTRGEIADGEELTLETRLNGKVMQKATTSMLIFDIPRLIEYVSIFTPLVPGDVIVTGTPGGVGVRRDPPVFMKDGDKVEIEIGKVGTLVNTVEREAGA